jgi:dipeptidyl aminopeptidase/acylaminoacyl peptidase
VARLSLRAVDVPLIPRRVLYGNPDRGRPLLSPDGARLAYLAPVDDVLNVWVGGADGDGGRPVTADADRGIRRYFWADDGRHLVYLQDSGGDENWHLHVVDPATGGDRDVTPFADVQVQVIGRSRRHPGRLALGINRDSPELHDAHVLDIASGELERTAQNPGYVEWLVDNDLRARGGTRMAADGGLTVELDGREVLATDPDDALSTHVVGFTADDASILLLTSAGANATRLVHVDAGGAVEVIAEDDVYDVCEVERNPQTHAVEFVSFQRARVEHRAIDPAVRGDLDAIAALHPGDSTLLSRTHADDAWTVAYAADDGPVAFYAYDRGGDGDGRFLFHHTSALAGLTLARMEPFAFTARDGLEVHGYLTFPPGVPRTGLPAVLLVHGGPWSRDVWGFDTEAQWLANRGYLSVQVNYRGSTGYGKRFLAAGDREWAAAMHGDLIDAVEHVVGAGFADRDRIGIYGGSYGGYAALVGATFTPDVFRCAVDIVGPSDLRTLLATIPPYWRPFEAQFHHRIGHPERDGDLLWERSPLSRVDAIRIPLLIAQGANDPRVKMSESDQIVAALERHGIPHRYIVYPDEGHGFRKPENAMAFQAEAERFLAEHLGGRFEP